MMFTRSTVLVFLSAATSVASARAQTTEPKPTLPVAVSVPAKKPVTPLPALSPGVTHVGWDQFIKTPVGDYGLELTDAIKTLDGKKVRLLGYMVRRDEPAPGGFFLAPYQIGVEEHEAGFADLPPQAVYVSIPYNATKIVPHTPRPLLLTGTFSVGQKRVENGMVSSLFRLVLDAPPVPKAKPRNPPIKISTPKAKSTMR